MKQRIKEGQLFVGDLTKDENGKSVMDKDQPPIQLGTLQQGTVVPPGTVPGAPAAGAPPPPQEGQLVPVQQPDGTVVMMPYNAAMMNPNGAVAVTSPVHQPSPPHGTLVPVRQSDGTVVMTPLAPGMVAEQLVESAVQA